MEKKEAGGAFVMDVTELSGISSPSPLIMAMVCDLFLIDDATCSSDLIGVE